MVNSTGLLYPGAYTEVHFKISPSRPSLLIPSTALLFRREGLHVPVVVNGNRVSLVPVTLGRDFGNSVEVVSGLSEDAQVIADPPDSLVDGEIVHIAQPKRVKKAEQ